MHISRQIEGNDIYAKKKAQTNWGSKWKREKLPQKIFHFSVAIYTFILKKLVVMEIFLATIWFKEELQPLFRAGPIEALQTFFYILFYWKK